MNPRDRDTLRTWFDGFVDGHRQQGQLPFLLQFKYEHSLRTARDSRLIAAELNWPEASRLTAEAIGLLHDTGRFPQLQEYGTFLDHQSVDHGEYGAEILRAHRVLDVLEPAERSVVHESVRYHNRYALREVHPASQPFLKLIRDADKLDIFYTVGLILKNSWHRQYPDLLVSVNEDGPPTPELIREVREHRTASYSNIRSLADIHLVRTAWIYGIHYRPVLRLILERRLLDDVWVGWTRHPELATLLDEAREFMRTRLETADPGSGPDARPARDP